jgi:Flp pilus assembly protein TadD
MNVAEDRLWDVALEEALGGEAGPPDLSAQILAVARAEGPPVLSSADAPAEVLGVVPPLPGEEDGEKKDGQGRPGAVSEEARALGIEVMARRALDVTHTPSYPEPGPHAPRWAKPGQLRRRGRTQRLIALAAAGVLGVGGGIAAYDAHQDRLAAEAAQEALARARAEVRRGVGLAEEELARARLALSDDDARAAFEAVSRARAHVDRLGGEELVGNGRARDADLWAWLLRARAEARNDETAVASTLLQQVEARLRESDEALWVGFDLARGELSLFAGDLDQAVDRFEAALARDPSHWEARLRLAEALGARHDLMDASANLQQLLTRWLAEAGLPSSDADRLRGRVFLARAEVLALRSEFELARAALASARGLVPEWRVEAARGDLLLRQGSGVAALEAFDRAVAGAEGSHEAVLRRGRARLALGEPAAALDDAVQARALSGVGTAALVLEAEAALALDDVQRAGAQARSALERARVRDWALRARAHGVLSELAGRAEDWNLAHRHAKEALAASEHDPEVAAAKARLELRPQFEAQWLDSANRLLRRALRQVPQVAAYERGLGAVLLQRYEGAPDRAERRLKEALKLDPKDPQTLALLGVVYDLQSRRGGARAASFRKAALRNRELAAREGRDVRRQAGRAFAQGLGHLRRAGAADAQGGAAARFAARRRFERAVWLNPRHAGAHTGLALLAAERGALLAARRHRQEAEAWGKDDPWLARVKAILEVDGASAGLRLSERTPAEAVELLVRAGSALDAGDAAEAARLAQRSLDLHPSASGWGWLAEARKAAGLPGHLSARLNAAWFEEGPHLGAVTLGLQAASGDVDAWAGQPTGDPDLVVLLAAASRVALALKGELETEAAKALFDQLEQVQRRHPERALPAALLGALAHGMGRRSYAERELLFALEVTGGTTLEQRERSDPAALLAALGQR